MCQAHFRQKLEKMSRPWQAKIIHHRSLGLQDFENSHHLILTSGWKRQFAGPKIPHANLELAFFTVRLSKKPVHVSHEQRVRPCGWMSVE